MTRMIAWAPRLLVVGIALFSYSHVRASCLQPPGDVNGSGAVNVADVVCALFAVLETASGKPLPSCLAVPDAADADCDGSVLVSDVLTRIRQALGLSLGSGIDSNGNGCPDTCDPPSEQAAPTLDCPHSGAKVGLMRLAGTGLPEHTVEVAAGDVVLGITGVSADGTWSLVVDPTPPEGAYSIAARQVSPSSEVSPWSPTVALIVDTTVPDAPTELGAIPADGFVHLDWEDSDASDLLGCNVYRKLDGEPDEAYVLVNVKLVGISAYRDMAGDPFRSPEVPPPSNGVRYCYQIRSVDGTDPSPCEVE